MYIYLCITCVHTGIYEYITSIHAACGDGKRCLRGSPQWQLSKAGLHFSCGGLCDL